MEGHRNDTNGYCKKMSHSGDLSSPYVVSVLRAYSRNDLFDKFLVKLLIEKETVLLFWISGLYSGLFYEKVAKNN